ENARIEDGYLYAQQTGTAKLIATFEGLAPHEIDVTIGEGSGDLEVAPQVLDLAVDEQYYLEIRAPGNYTVTSSDPAIVSTSSGAPNLVEGITEGTAELVVRTDSGQEKTINVTVTPAVYDSIIFQPGDITVAVGSSVPFSVIGITEDGTEVKLTGKKLTWKHPDPDYVTIDKDAMLIRGYRITGDNPQPLGISYGGKEATSLVTVVAGAPDTTDPLWAILGTGTGLKHHDTIPFVEQQIVKTYPTFREVDGGIRITEVPSAPVFNNILTGDDVITSIGGTRIVPGTDVNAIWGRYIDGLQRVPIEIIRNGEPTTVYLEPDVRVVNLALGDSDDTTFTVQVTVHAPKLLPGTQVRLSDRNSKLEGPMTVLDPATMTATLTSPRFKKLSGFDVSYPTFVETIPPRGTPKRYPYTIRLQTTVREGDSTGPGIPAPDAVDTLPDAVIPAPDDSGDNTVEGAIKRAL
ncbi:MAG: PDZ domain-containing protein, partial [Pirellulales bacterium]|nr:PDZ domain-containing protein [Pirellulales bacterium]